MTDRELMQQALDYLDAPSSKVWAAGTQYKIIQALRARLAQPEPKIYNDIDEMFRDMGVPVTEPEPEPVAWMHPEWNTYTRAPAMSITPKEDWIPLYTAPPQREFIGLTDEEIGVYTDKQADFARAIEAKLKEKNA